MRLFAVIPVKPFAKKRAREAAHAVLIKPVPVHRDGLAFHIDMPEDYQQL